jgi:type I restriction enzyme S subunit
MSFPRYPKYKESGVEWLGQVPEHWSVKRLKQVFREREERSRKGEELLLSVSAYTGVTPRADVIDEGDHLSRAETLENYKICYKNDLVVNIMLAWNRGLAVTDYDGIVSPAYCVYRIIDDSDPRFLNYLVRSDRQILYFKAFSSGVIDSRLRIYPETFGGLFCACPPLSEQTAIADFLDHETVKIDELIAEQERLIELLKEKRQAVISHAVTKGLNPATPMKDSGIEWIDQVPEHWRIGKCGFYLNILTGFAFPSAGFSDDETQTKLLRGINVGVSRLKWDETVYWQRKPGDGLEIYEMCAGDLVIGMDRPLIAEGMRVSKVKESDLPCLLLQRVASLKTGGQLAADYIHSLLSSEMFIAHFAPETTGVSVPHISPEQIYNFVIPVPPLEEQERITDYIFAQSTQLDTLTTEAQKAITLFQERRSALISAAVTGQIDVRGIQQREAA